MAYQLRFIAILFFLLTSGCANHGSFNAIPVNDGEFQASLADLSEKYRDIEGKKSVRAVSDAPLVQELYSAWGEPDSVEYETGRYIEKLLILASAIYGYEAFDDWLHNREYPIPSVSGGVFATFLLIEPFPRKILLWRKGNKEIRVKVIRTIRGGYRAQVIGWEWRDINSKPLQ